METSRHRAVRGFTLIELMVGIAVMAMLALMSWQGLDGMMRVQSYNRERGDAVTTLQTTLAQWGADLDATVVMPQIQPIAWNGQVLRLTRRGADGTQPVLYVVAWAMSADTATGMRWRRWQSGAVATRAEWQRAWAQADAWAQGSNETLRGTEVTLMPLTSWQLQYFRGAAWTDAASGPNAVGGLGVGMPDGIRLVLNLPPGPGLAGLVTRDWIRPTVAIPKT
ncbi:MAG: prepilin-type N-terminal cleavage/methylation domain-containing protein [Variovorax sp.]|jgi:general secretion pathway protein J|nr:MAG: prepilin-type N-terminal cleavage/methylation domain-containing protein [Variovorax sp.]